MPKVCDTRVVCRPHFRPIAEQVELAALTRVIAAQNQPAILGGNVSVRGISIFAAEPVDVLECRLDEPQPFEKLRTFLSKYQLKDPAAGLQGFCGGWIGYFGYEQGRFIERLPQRAGDDVGLPVMRLAFYDKAILYDHQTNRFSLVAVQMDDETMDEKFATLAGWVNQAKQLPCSSSASSANEADAAAIQSTMTQSQYVEALRKIHRYIIDGEVYQINYSQRFSAPFTAKPVDLYNWQNQHNPSPYAACLAWDTSAVVSASPELFLDVHGDAVLTCPIKGTRPRNAALPEDSPLNRSEFAALVESQKDQAELAMIVDLERNDLARVCIPGTRHVPCARRIETFPTVYHAVASVKGTLALPPGPGRIEALLRATFPGGSITGAPKIRAMEIIDELEPTARGVYTGSIGWIGLNFDLCLNIAIRTIIIHNKIAYIQTGGGIVADSDPQAEWEETLTKARILLAGVKTLNGCADA